ncbi:MAG TPA: hypothetical protein VK438_06630 [Xanthobacteraceae bacterium]|nr:hypothetical protein [Xanthobacteraceae bacterium]
MKIRVIVLAALIGAADTAFASEPQVGRWAVDASSCHGAGDTHRTAPLTVTPTSMRWAGESCTIGKMYKADQALYIEGRCSNGDGLMKKHPITLAMKGEHLAVTWNGEHTEMQRCP